MSLQGHWLCPESVRFKRHQMAALGDHAYLYVLPPARRLAPGHVCVSRARRALSVAFWGVVAARSRGARLPSPSRRRRDAVPWGGRSASARSPAQ